MVVVSFLFVEMNIRSIIEIIKLVNGHLVAAVAEKEDALKTKRVFQAQMARDAKKALKEKRVLKTKKARDAKKGLSRRR